MTVRTALLCFLVLPFFVSCKGKVVIPPEAQDTVEECEGADCPSGVTCTPLDTEGVCPEQSSCIAGACYMDTDVSPAPCGPDTNGWCQGDGACQDGACIPVVGLS